MTSLKIENLLGQASDSVEKQALADPALRDFPAYTLTLKDIASWQFPVLAAHWSGQFPPIVAALPSLQRGPVWKPHQVELLWDSILRGFPIGSLVVCRRLQTQKSRTGRYGTEWPDDKLTHHLLDGQQRCNAVALGFQDPFSAERVSQQAEQSSGTPSHILWLDLQPTQFDKKPARFLANSSRAYLVRVATAAHPWGYKTDDDLKTLEAHVVRDALKDEYGWLAPDDDNYVRPKPVDIWPSAANVPVPMAWLIQAAEQSQSVAALWQHLLQRCNSHITTLHNDNEKHWSRVAAQCLQTSVEYLNDLGQALLGIKDLRLVALTVPETALIRETRQESTIQNQAGNERIANVEHLFQRLNSGGTELRGDDLLYSMIKAYWPGIEKAIDNIKLRPPATQVALLGARLALSKELQGPMPEARASLSVTALRGMAQTGGASSDTKTADRQQDEAAIKQIFGLNYLTGPSSNSTEIAAIIQKVDEWLLYRPQTDCNPNPTGLPAVLRSRMAEQAPEVFHFLMCLAQVCLKSGVVPTTTAMTRLRGLTTALHWFGQDRSRAVTYLWERGPLADWLTGDVYNNNPNLLRTLKRHPKDNWVGLCNLLSPDDLAKVIASPNDANLATWNWWNTLIKDAVGLDASGNVSQASVDAQSALYWPMLQNLKTNNMLLIYGQREWMRHKFSSYDPSFVGYWDDHNRPWDYDHLLPQNAFYNRKQGNTYLTVCQQWGHTIGNLHVLPFEQNRSRHDDLASNSLPSDAQFLSMALLDKPQSDMRGAFSITGRQVEDSEPDHADSRRKVLGFVQAARFRLLRLYREWYESLDIGSML